MASRQSRSASIPVPRSASSTSPTRNMNIESVFSLPFSASPAASRSRLPSTPQRASAARSFTVPSSVASAHINRGSPRTFEPRVIRASDMSGPRTSTSTSNNVECAPSPSTNRTRRASGAGTGARAPSAHRSSAPMAAPSPAPPVPFPRPAYLEHSALRHLLHTEPSPSPSLPPVPTTAPVEPSAVHARTHSPPTDSDDESVNVSPPRDMASTPIPSIEGGEGTQPLPTRWSEQVRHQSLSVSSDGRDLIYSGPVSSGDKDAAAARTSHPVPAVCGIYYYEVKIVSKGQKGHISIGFAGKDVRLSRLPGWEKNSWGYHGDDGFSFAAERSGTPYGPTFGTGDVIGCGIDFSQNKAFYTKNGTFLGMVFDKVGKDGPIFPSVGLRHTGETVRVNFGHEPFKYDIEDHVLQQRDTVWKGVMGTGLGRIFGSSVAASASSTGASGSTSGEGAGAGVVEFEGEEQAAREHIGDLVLSYLAHHGYAKTARAFKLQCDRRGRLDGGLASPGSAPLPIPPPPAPISVSSHDHDMGMDTDELSLPAPTSPLSSASQLETDISERIQIVNAVSRGEIDNALSALRARHPAVLEQEEGMVLFKLRCRKFVELVLEAAEMKKRAGREEGVSGGAGGEGTGAMDVDDEAPVPVPAPAPSTNGSAAIPIKAKRKQSISNSSASTSSLSHHSTAATAQYEAALSTAITYGQTLQSDYKADTRPDVQAIFKRTFGVVAYNDPLAAGGEVAEVAGVEARVKLAGEVNRAILHSQGKPTHPALERLYRQTAASVLQLGLMGVGAAAFADMQKEFLDA